MINQFQKSVLIMALYAGEIMMKSGAEIYRVEDTIIRICKACKIPFVECFATTTGIFLSLDSGEQEGDMFTFIKRIKYITINLEKISKLNEFSRVFTTTDLSVADGMRELRLIDHIKPFNLPMNILAAVLIGAFLCPTFGGSPIDMACAGGVAVIIYLISEAVDKLKFIDFVRIFISCGACALLALLLVEAGIATTLSPVIIGAMTMFLPGVSITNAARDILSGDMLSGTSRFVDALLTAIGIAGGVGVVLSLWQLSGGEIVYGRAYAYPIPALLVFAVITTVGFSIMFNVPRKHIPLAALIGGFGSTVKQVAVIYEYDGLIACFLGACVVAALSEFASRAGKDATTLFIIPGIIPLVPGATLYSAMQSVLANNMTDAAQFGTQALLYAGAIAIALVIVASVTRIYIAVLRRIKDKVSRLRK